MSGRENTVLQWAYNLNSAPASAETWHLKDISFLFSVEPSCS